MKTFYSVVLTAIVMFFIGYLCGFNQLINVNRDAIVDVVVTMSPSPSPTSTPVPSYTALSKGDRGDNVIALQERLAKLGYSVGEIDGIYGAKTAAAVSAFQEKASLPASGSADTSTLKLLYSTVAFGYMAEPAHTPTPKPTPTPTRKPTSTPRVIVTPKPTATPKPDKRVYITATGECWHTIPNCGNSRYVTEIWLSEAVKRGYRNCSRC